MNIIMSFKDCLPPILQNIKASIEDNTDNEDLQKCLIEIAEIAPKYLKTVLDEVFEICIHVISKLEILISSLNKIKIYCDILF